MTSLFLLSCNIFLFNSDIFFKRKKNYRSKFSNKGKSAYMSEYIGYRVKIRGLREKQKSYLKHSIYFLTYTLVIQIRIGKLAHQLVHSCHDVRHFFPRDTTVAIDVVKGKCPAQFLIDGTTRQYAETSNEVLQHRDEKFIFSISL